MAGPSTTWTPTTRAPRTGRRRSRRRCCSSFARRRRPGPLHPAHAMERGCGPRSGVRTVPAPDSRSGAASAPGGRRHWNGSPSGTEHLPSLTSLRFVAAALVLVHHLVIYAPTLTVVSQLASIGYVGVTFFFVLSGFVLTWAWSPELQARTFYRRRFARVYPVHLLFVVVSAFSERLDWGALPANVSLLQAWSPDDTVVRSFSGVSWSLSCEL